MLKAIQNRVTRTVEGRWAAMLLGTLIGTLPGVLIQVLVSNFGRISSISGIAIIGGGMMGYQWSRMRMRVPGLLYVLALGITMSFVGEALAVWVQGVIQLSQEYGMENFGIIAWNIVPTIIREDPDIRGAIIVNGMLSLILSVPTGIWMFFSYCRNNQKLPEEGGELPLVFRPCPEDRGGNLSLRLGKRMRLIWWLIAIGSVSLTGVLAWVMGGEAPAVLAVFSLLPLIILVRAIYSSRQRYTLTDSGLEIHSFGTREIPYQALREGAQGKPPEVNRMCLTLTADGRRIRINTFSMEGADQFLTELFRRMDVERPWNYHYLFKG